MSKHISYGKTTDFKSCIRNIQHAARFESVDENGEAIYNTNPLPTLTFIGTTKLHGTNAAVTWQEGNLACQSRNNIVETGHFGFPEMIQQEIYAVTKMVDYLRVNTDIKDGEKLTVYGEWAGPGVQTDVGISCIPRKTWFPFAAKITDVEGDGRWIKNFHSIFVCDSDRIKQISLFGDAQIEIDFNNPKAAQNQIIEMALAVEANCPVASRIIGGEETQLGEGMVWETFYKGERFTFKCKGPKHSVTKIKTSKPIDMDKLGRINDFVDYCVTENRVKQAMFEAIPKNLEMGLTKADTGSIIQWMESDILSEETFEMKERELEWKEVANTANAKARQLFFTELDKV